MKAATAKYTAEELITRRQQVKDDTKTILTEIEQANPSNSHDSSTNALINHFINKS